MFLTNGLNIMVFMRQGKYERSMLVRGYCAISSHIFFTGAVLSTLKLIGLFLTENNKVIKVLIRINHLLLIIQVIKAYIICCIFF